MRHDTGQISGSKSAHPRTIIRELNETLFLTELLEGLMPGKSRPAQFHSPLAWTIDRRVERAKAMSIVRGIKWRPQEIAGDNVQIVAKPVQPHAKVMFPLDAARQRGMMGQFDPCLMIGRERHVADDSCMVGGEEHG